MHSDENGTKAKRRRTRQFDVRVISTLKFFDANAARHYAPIAQRTFYQAIADGKMKASRIGGTGKLVVTRATLDSYIAGAPVENNLDKIVEDAVDGVLG